MQRKAFVGVDYVRAYKIRELKGVHMTFRDMFRPKWRHSDPAVRLTAVKSMAGPANAEALHRVLAEDTSEDVRRAAEHNLGAMAVSLAKGVFGVADGEFVVRPKLPAGCPANLVDDLGFGERRGKLLVFDSSRLNSCLRAARKLGKDCAQPVVKELRHVLSALDEIHSEVGTWSVDIFKMDEENRMFLSTVSTAGSGTDKVYVFDLESVRKEIAEVVDSFKS